MRTPARLLPLVLVLAVGTAHAGGYVQGTQVLTQASSFQITGAVSPVTTFNNATLTDQNMIGEVHNDLVKTPSTSDPVSTVTGNNYHDETDLFIRGRGIDYAFTRTYNSAPSSTKVDKGLGFGWVHSYAMRLKSNDYGSCPNCTAAQAAVNGNGKTSSITYTDERGGDHNYLVNEASFAVTLPQGEFNALALDTPAVGQHTLTFRNGVRYVFETVGAGSLKTTPGLVARLRQIADPFGNQLNFAYDTNGRLSTVADNLGISGRTGLTFGYDTAGHMKTLTDWTGRTWTYVIDANGNLASITNPLNQSLLYSYATGTHNLTQIQKPLRGVRTAFTYYQNGRTFNYADALGNTETLDYDLYRKTTRVTDARGGVRSYEYDASGRLTKLTEPDGAILQFQNQPDGLRYTKTDGLGYLTQYSYRSDKTFNTVSDTFGNVTREQDALNQTVDTTYGPYDQVATLKDKRGTVRTTSFHATTDTVCKLAGKPDTVTLSQLTATNGTVVSNVKLASYCWNSDGTLKSQTEYLDPANTTKTRVTAPTYDTAAHLNVQSVAVTGWDGTSVTKSYTYDSLGRKSTETLNRRTSPSNSAPMALTTAYAYDALDRPVQVTDALGNWVETVFDANGQVYQVIGHYQQADGTFAARVQSTRYYDAADRLVQDVDVLGNALKIAYDPAGNVVAMTDRENHTTAYAYDEMNRRTAVIDANGNRTTTTFDLAGHAVALTNANGETTAFVYDKIGRLIQVTDALGYISTTAYDANNNATCMVDANAQAGLKPKNANGCTVFTSYDQLNRPTQVKDAANAITQTSYDLLGNVLAITDAAGKVTSYSYDGLGRLVKVTDPLTKTTLYALDEAGNAWQTSNRLGQLTNSTFDALNRLTRADYATDGTSELLSYDAFGNLQRVSNGSIGYSFGYDAKSRLTSKTDLRSGKTLSFTYDRADNILTKTDYQNETTAYTYDSANQRVAMKNSAYLSASYQHDAAGRLLARILSDGAQTQFTWNAGGQLTGMRAITANGTVLNYTTYTRDRIGNITSQVDASGSTNFVYDALYRLTSADYPASGNDESFVYDAVGNRTSQTLNGAVHVYEYYPTSNRLQAIHAGTIAGAIEKSFVYDDEGRLTSQAGAGAKTLTWDQKNRARQIASGTSTLSFTYDPMNYRVGRNGGTLGNRDYYLEGEHLEAEYSGANLQAKYFRGLSTDELVAGFAYDASGNWKPAIYHHDLLMSVTGISAHDGATVETDSYSAFGDRTVASTGASNNRLKYTGRELDQDTGLYYYRARYYDPTIGRFVSEDPLGFGAGINFYAYVGNNPVNANDPDGRDPLHVGAAILGGLGGVIVQGGADLARGELSSFADYAGALVGGGVGGVAAVSCGPVCAGAAAGAASNVTTQSINWATGQAVSFANFVTDTAIGAVGGKVAGTVVPYVFKNYVSKPIKGAIGEAMTWLDLTFSGRTIAESQVSNGVGKSTFDFLTTAGTFVEAKFGTSSLSTPQRQAASLLGNAFELQHWDYGTFSGIVGSSFSAGVVGADYGSAAAGGFLLYPNKANTNQLSSVYSK